jgi:hypothetical protein
MIMKYLVRCDNCRTLAARNFAEQCKVCGSWFCTYHDNDEQFLEMFDYGYNEFSESEYVDCIWAHAESVDACTDYTYPGTFPYDTNEKGCYMFSEQIETLAFGATEVAMAEKAVLWPYYIHCEGLWDMPEMGNCGLQKLTEEQYMRQLSNPDSFWKCPKCGMPGMFDDDSYDLAMKEEQRKYYEEHPDECDCGDCPSCLAKYDSSDIDMNYDLMDDGSEGEKDYQYPPENLGDLIRSQINMNGCGKEFWNGYKHIRCGDTVKGHDYSSRCYECYLSEIPF